jgi:hypothetical protein
MENRTELKRKTVLERKIYNITITIEVKFVSKQKVLYLIFVDDLHPELKVFLEKEYEDMVLYGSRYFICFR